MFLFPSGGVTPFQIVKVSENDCHRIIPMVMTPDNTMTIDPACFRIVVLVTISARGIGVQCRGFGGVQIRTVMCTIMIVNLCLILTSRSGIAGENGFLVFSGVL